MSPIARQDSHEPPPASTVADRLKSARRRRFVGRAAELELFLGALAAPEPPFSVLWIHGPGGVGKTALLGALAEAAADAGVDVVSARSARDRAFATGVHGRARARTRAARRGVSAGGACRRASLRCCCWTPSRLRSGSRTGCGSSSSRRCRRVRWSWWRAGTPPGRRGGGIRGGATCCVWCPCATSGRTTRGPSCVARVSRRSSRLGCSSSRTATRSRCRCWWTCSRSGRRRRTCIWGRWSWARRPTWWRSWWRASWPGCRVRAIGWRSNASAHARLTTAGLLSSVFGDREGEELFSWLRGLSFIESGPYGVFPHDLAREVIDADLRWRDPAAYRDMHTRVRRHVVERISGSEGRERERALADLIFLHRANPAAAALWDWKSLGEVYADGLRGGDVEAIVAMVERLRGRRSRRRSRSTGWSASPRGSTSSAAVDPSCWALLRRSLCTRPARRTSHAIPAARAVWAHAQRHAPPRPGDEVLLGAVPDRPRRVSGAVALVQRGDHAKHAGVAGAPASFLVLHRVRRSGGDGAADGLHRLPSGSGGRLRSRRAEVRGVRARLAPGRRRGMARADGRTRARRRSAGAESGARANVPQLALSQPEFADAVRRALRDLHRPGALATNPLARTRVVRERGAELPAPEALRELLHEAIDALRADPRGEKLVRALECTYLRPAPTQEAAAELLGSALQHLPRPPDARPGAGRGLALAARALRRRRVAGHRPRAAEQKLGRSSSGISAAGRPILRGDPLPRRQRT